jgi:nitroimidazol reductase NimA-like FMN-containing flavoprotein (pyridoxamine 5'-phosphate oxidase superfamily)
MVMLLPAARTGGGGKPILRVPADATSAMLIEAMTASQCHEFLARMELARLGCAHDGVPYVVPIHYAYEPGRLYSFTTLGRKVEWMRANPKVCVEVYEFVHSRSWKSVIANGDYKELPNEDRHMRERQRAYRLLEKHFLWWETAFLAEQPRAASHPSPAILYCIEVASVTGRIARSDEFDAARPQQRAAYY